MAVVDRCHRGRGRDTLLPCNLLPFFHKHMHMRSGVGPALIYPALPPHPPSSAGDPLGGPRLHSMQSPQLPLRDFAGTAGNCLGLDWLAGGPPCLLESKQGRSDYLTVPPAEPT